MDELLKDLNEAQRAAVEYLDGPLMIIAGAGSGKTRVITYRIAFLAREVGIPVQHVLAVTFTNKAAREMRNRVCELLGLPDMPSLPIGTFHSRCAMILRREAEAAGLDRNFAILDENDQKQAIKKTLKKMELSEKRARPAQVQGFINQAKMRLLTPQDCEEEFDEEEIPYPEIYKNYQNLLEENKSVDFEDLLMKTVQLFQENEDIRRTWAQRYQYVLVDEYQDTNHAQFLLTKLLAQDHGNVCIVGDEDQSIYSWRGAEISNLLDFEKSFPGTKIIKLERNYRSTNIILRAANKVIEHNTQRIGKTLYTEEGEGDPLTFLSSRNHEEEAQRIARECLRIIQMEQESPNEIAVFYRGHWLSRSLEDQFRQYRLPYRIVGGVRFYDRAEIKDLLSFMRLAINPDDDLAFERVINRPTRGVGSKTLTNIATYSASRGVSLIRGTGQLLEAGEIKGKARSGLDSFVSSIYQWNAMAGEKTAFDVLKRIEFDTNYREEGIGDVDSLEAENRVANIEEFEGVVEEFSESGNGAGASPPDGEGGTSGGRLSEFLTSMALDASQQQNDHTPKVNLLTLHNAKGLEFDHVFIVGLEHGVFPTNRAIESMEIAKLEEERRLFYVGVTRTRRKLFLSYAMQRNRPDFFANNQPSQFLNELPPEVFDEESREKLKRLLPYGWGKQKLRGEREVVYDNDESFGPSRHQPGAFARMTRGAGAPLNTAIPGKKKFDVGMRVEHRLMGLGTISDVGGRPGWERAHIEFDDGRSQEFVLRYAPIKVVE